MRRPLTILHVDTERGWRGGERQVLWLAERLLRDGHRSLVACRPGEPLAARAGVAGLPVVPSTPVGEIDLLAALRLRCVVLRERVDIVHAHTAHAVALAALATLATPARAVLTRRVNYPLSGNPASRWKYARAAAVIAVCRAAADALVASGVPAERVSVVYSGVDLDRDARPASSETLAALGVPPGAPLVVQVGALVPQKDPLTFVRAIDVAHGRVSALHALLVGDGALRPAIEAEIAARGLTNVVHLAGFRADADALLAAADVVALSSADEGVGGVTIDAMSFGRPVAATAAGGVPEVVPHDEAGLIVPVGDAAALGDAIARLLEYPALAARLGDAGRRRAPCFAIDRTVRGTEEVYSRVMAKSRR